MAHITSYSFIPSGCGVNYKQKKNSHINKKNTYSTVYWHMSKHFAKYAILINLVFTLFNQKNINFVVRCIKDLSAL